jgi:hypothetical protein
LSAISNEESKEVLDYDLITLKSGKYNIYWKLYSN